MRLLGARHPLLDPAVAVPIDLELANAARARDQRPEHGRQDGGAEDARPGRAAPPVRPPPACGDGGAAGLRRGARRHRRPAVDRDEPLDLLGARRQPGRDPRRGERAIARARRRARLRDGSRRGLRARAGAARAARGAGAAHDRDDALPRAEGVGQLDRRRRQRGDRVRPRHARAALPGRARAAGHVACAADRGAARARRRRRRGRPRAGRSPSGCGSRSCSPRRRPPSAPRRPSSMRPRAERAEAERLAAGTREREEVLESEIAAVRASAAGERERAAAEAQRDLAAAREELRGLREEINVARRREREARRASPAAAVRAERDRDRRLGAARPARRRQSRRCAHSTSRCR